MKIVILSRSASVSSTRRLLEAAKERGHHARVVNPAKVEMVLDGASASFFYRRKKLSHCDVVIPRIAQSISNFGLAVVNQFGIHGVPLMNTAQAIAQARNKMRCLQLLSANGIGIPATVMARDASDLKHMVSHVGGVPVLVKLIQGQEKDNIIVCETLQSLEATLDAVLGLGHNLVVQQYVKKTGQDVRVFVVGGKAVAAVRRKAQFGKLAHTLIRGARLERIDLTDAQRRAAVESARLVGLEVAAVDLLDVKGQPKVFEVNSSPSITSMEAATGVDIASLIIARAEELAAARAKRIALRRERTERATGTKR